VPDCCKSHVLTVTQIVRINAIFWAELEFSSLGPVRYISPYLDAKTIFIIFFNRCIEIIYFHCQSILFEAKKLLISDFFIYLFIFFFLSLGM
jgi:hypothetical protein